MLNIQNLKKSYGSLAILKGISLEIKEGEFVSLLGASGSGKTTMLRCIAGLERPDTDSGTISLATKIFSDSKKFIPPEKRNLGMVFQNYAVWPHMTVFENVAYPLRLRKESNITAKVEDTLKLTGLAHLKERLPFQLSGGQQQRVALSRALVMSPQVLLLDEPLSNLDALLREELGSEIRKLQKKLKLTTILVTHDQKEALSLSDRIVLLENGTINALGTPEELYQNPPTDFAAQFLAGGQKLDGTKNFLPRRWIVSQSGIYKAKIQSRLFLGSEYEYRAKSDALTDDIRFFSSEKLSEGSDVSLSYS